MTERDELKTCEYCEDEFSYCEECGELCKCWPCSCAMYEGEIE